MSTNLIILFFNIIIIIFTIVIKSANVYYITDIILQCRVKNNECCNKNIRILSIFILIYMSILGIIILTDIYIGTKNSDKQNYILKNQNFKDIMLFGETMHKIDDNEQYILNFVDIFSIIIEKFLYNFRKNFKNLKIIPFYILLNLDSILIIILVYIIKNDIRTDVEYRSCKPTISNNLIIVLNIINLCYIFNIYKIVNIY